MSGCCTGTHRCGRYPVSIDLCAEEGKEEPIHFDPHALGDRQPTGELIAHLNHLLLLQSSP